MYKIKYYLWLVALMTCFSISADATSVHRLKSSTVVEKTNNTDTDGDGLPDELEDANGNGVVDSGETDPNNEDTDGDTLLDGQEDANANGEVDKDLGETDPLNADTDGDDYDDGEEVNGIDNTDTDPIPNGTSDPNDPCDPNLDARPCDRDDDGLTNEKEDFNGDGVVDSDETDRTNPDTDGDNLLDGQEVILGTNPLHTDTDGDGISDDIEVAAGMDPICIDTDGDGVHDGIEDSNKDGVVDSGETDPKNPCYPEMTAGTCDADNDGLTNEQEDLDMDGIVDQGETNPWEEDTDSDGIFDGDEVAAGTDPNSTDTDGDGLSDDMDADPNDSDADNDGLLDDEEQDLNGDGDYDDPNESDPNDPCSPNLDASPCDYDEDGLTYAQEDFNEDGVVDTDEGETDPEEEDTDDDGLSDGAEITAGTDPNKEDTDGDGFSDGAEIARGTDPLDPDTDNDGYYDGEEVDGSDNTDTPLIMPNTPSDPIDECSPGSSNKTKNAAIALNIDDGCTYYSNFCAEEETSLVGGCGNMASVWYTFTVGTGGYYEIRTKETNFNNVLTLFDAASNQLTCVNEDKFSFGEHLYQNLQANSTYFVMVSGAEDGIGITEGEFCIEVNTISASIPNNQYCNTNLPTIDLATNSEECVTGSNRYASSAYPQPSCSPYTGASVWYKIQMPLSGDKIQINAAAHYSEVITIYAGTCGGLTEIACKMNGPDSSEGLIVSNLVPSAIYYMQVTGNFVTIEADNSAASCNDSYITISTSPNCLALCDQPCDDNNPDTIDDMWDANCNCTGVCLYSGDACDDGDSSNDQTGSDTFDGQCNCVSCVPGQSCEDENPNTSGETWDIDCNCTGGTCPHAPGVACDDSNPNTGPDQWDANCNCTGICPHTPDTACDDGDPNTENDTWTASCKCIGTPCVDNIIVDAGNVSHGLFIASDFIETELDGAVSVDQSLELNAGNYILLRPGFTASEGTYFHAYIDGCEQEVEPKTDEFDLISIKHYPNPFRDEFTLEFTIDVDAEARIVVSDVNGRKVAQTSLDNLNRGIQTHNIPTKNWIAGVYFYQIQIKETNTGILKYANGTLVKM